MFGLFVVTDNAIDSLRGNWSWSCSLGLSSGSGWGWGFYRSLETTHCRSLILPDSIPSVFTGSVAVGTGSETGAGSVTAGVGSVAVVSAVYHVSMYIG